MEGLLLIVLPAGLVSIALLLIRDGIRAYFRKPGASTLQELLDRPLDLRDDRPR